MRYTSYRYLTAIALAIAGAISIIASGGGGGGSSFSPTNAQGLWTGTTDTGRAIFGIVLDDGDYWFIYTRVVGAPPVTVVDSFIQGTGSSSGSDFSSSNVRNFNGQGFFNSGSLDASFSSKDTLDGTFTYPGFTEVLNTTFDAAYDLTPSLAAIAGTYNGESNNIPAGGSRNASAVITSAGVITVAGAGDCNNFLGTILPHAEGNVYDVAGTITNVDCVPGDSRDVNGIAFVDATPRLHLTAVDSDRSHGYFLTGVEP